MKILALFTTPFFNERTIKDHKLDKEKQNAQPKTKNDKILQRVSSMWFLWNFETPKKYNFFILWFQSAILIYCGKRSARRYIRYCRIACWFLVFELRSACTKPSMSTSTLDDVRMFLLRLRCFVFTSCFVCCCLKSFAKKASQCVN